MGSMGKVLCVDDDDFVLRLMQACVEGHFEVALASSAEEGLALMEAQGPFRVVVSDYNMPGMRGDEFLRQVAQRWPETIRILISGGAMDMNEMDLAIRTGCVSRFLTKPFRITSFCDQLRHECQL